MLVKLPAKVWVHDPTNGYGPWAVVDADGVYWLADQIEGWASFRCPEGLARPPLGDPHWLLVVMAGHLNLVGARLK